MEQLEKLLHFQAQSGNFPRYLHEYPEAQSYSKAVDILAPLYFIYRDFQAVLPASLKSALQNALQKLINYCQPLLDSGSLKLAKKLKLEALLTALNHCPVAKSLDEFNCLQISSPAKMADILLALAIAPQLFQNSARTQYLSFIKSTWQNNLRSYCGPIKIQEAHLESISAAVYHFYMSYLFGGYCWQADRSIFDLGAVLVDKNTLLPEINFESYPQDFQLFLAEESSLTLCRKDEYVPMRYYWQKGGELKTLEISADTVAKLETYDVSKNRVKLLFNLDDPFQQALSAKEICFSFPALFYHLQAYLGDKVCSSFEIGSWITLKSDCETIFRFKFEVETGDGIFMGHIMPATKQVSQDCSKDSCPDLSLFLRTIKRSNHLQISCEIEGLKNSLSI